MDEAYRDAELERTAADWRAAREHAEHLAQRIGEVAAQIAEAEEGVADAYEKSARLRPHAADRLLSQARDARAFAERERRAAVALAHPPNSEDD